MKTMNFIVVAAAASFAGNTVQAAELQANTLSAWKERAQASNLRNQERIEGRAPFLWMDESPDRAARVRHGEVVVAPMLGRGAEEVPHGLVHDWIGVTFIPGATVDSVMAVVRDYDAYQHMYRPVVTSSRTIASSDAGQEFQMVWQRKVLFVNAAMQGHYHAHEVLLDAHRGYSVAEADEVREIEDYGHEGERLLPPDTGNGYIWRIRSVARFEERDGGVYLELEAMALTRDIPSSLAWMVKPVVNHLSVNSLTTTLRQTREAVVSRQEDVAASRPNRTHSSIARRGSYE